VGGRLADFSFNSKGEKKKKKREKCVLAADRGGKRQQWETMQERGKEGGRGGEVFFPSKKRERIHARKRAFGKENVERSHRKKKQATY